MILISISSVFLILIVLLQPSKGGASSTIAGGIPSQIMGVKRSTDLLEKLTWGFAIAIMLFTITSNFFLENEGENEIKSVNVEKAQELPSVGGSVKQESQNEEKETEE
jgi:preprotein translocase subunit SecG